MKFRQMMLWFIHCKRAMFNTSFWGERQFVEFFFKWSHLHRFVISSRVDVWASFLSWQIMLSQHYPLSVRYLFEMRNWTIYNTTGNTYRSINRINKIKKQNRSKTFRIWPPLLSLFQVLLKTRAFTSCWKKNPKMCKISL